MKTLIRHTALKTGRVFVLLICGSLLWTLAIHETVATEASVPLVVKRVDDDGTLHLADGDVLVLAGLDQAHRVVRPNRFYLSLLRKLQSQHPMWMLRHRNPDRYGRLAGQVYLSDGTWLQGLLVRAGAARFLGGVDMEIRDGLLHAEQEARTLSAGLWDSGTWVVHDSGAPDSIGKGFQIVEGVVTGVRRVKGVVYINFGDDWRTDFTAGARGLRTVSTEDGRSLKLRDLQGRAIRVRGIVRFYNGPYVDIASPDQIEVLPGNATDIVTD